MSNSSRHSGRDRRHPYRRDGRNDRDFRDSRDTRNNSGPPPRDGYRPSYPSFDANRDRNHDQGRPRDVPPYPGTDRGADSYRPPQSDFTFRVDKPAGIQLANSYRPQHDRLPRNDRRDIRSFHSDSRKNARDRRQGRDRPRRPFIAAERELLKANHDDGEGIALYDPNGGVTYRPLNELSDSDEAEMDISDDDAAADATDGDEPPHKRARLGVQQSTSESVTPKWSNPDPYTALPPETVPQGKKKDVVQLIRKSRVQTNPVRTSLPTETADFIALDLDSEESEAGNEAEAPTESPEAPEAPDEVITISDDDQSIDGEEEASESEISAPSGPGEPVTHRQDAFISPSDLATFTLASSRKRTHDGEIKMPHAPLKQATRKRGAGAILKEWRPTPEMHPTPWLERDHSDSANMAVWLHKEIVDFYEWIKPRDFEAYQRQKLIEKLSDMVREEFHTADVYPFGSFPSGLYLPTGDMDVAMMSNSYVKGGAARFTGTRVLYRFKDYLVRHRIAWANEIQLITRARVPLVKFVEIKTGLKVDVSFENSTGVAALKTFRAWREKYPGMPALVTIIKQFLMMRGLNEPVNGGIGGFSVICLVVSMLQQMPEVNSGNLDTRHHLGQLLLHFFDLYGNKFDYEKVAISLNPPRWIPKVSVS
jgi:non-canonical poly(A) RNA polymerase PAPD5/7